MTLAILLLAFASALSLFGARSMVRRSRKAWLVAAVVVLVAAIMLVLAVEPMRWQLYAPLGLAVLALLTAVLRLSRGAPDRPRWCSALAATGAASLFALALLPPLLFPMFTVPEPVGEMPVGTRSIALVDPDRPDPVGGAPSGQRELAIRAWYPASRADADRETAQLMSKGVADGMVSGATPTFIFQHLQLIGTASVVDAPIWQDIERAPIVIFVPGFRSFTTQSSVLAQDLASQGFVVLAIGSPGDASALEYPDSRIAAFNNDSLLADEKGVEALTRATTATNVKAQRAAIGEALEEMRGADATLRHQVADVRLLADVIAREEVDGFAGHLDTSRVFIVGMSLGGAVAAQACAELSICAGAVNLDGFQFGDFFERSYPKPLLVLMSDRGEVPPLNGSMYRERGSSFPNNVLYREIAGASHLDFTDFTLAAPWLKRWAPNPLLGAVNGEDMVAATSSTITGFLRSAIAGRSASFRIRSTDKVRFRSVDSGSKAQP
ncbi:hypothetical protein HME9302_02077 [Alteripontixanthobacter maritimus]|uniref:1-alkyl-2-acetylglycerophosphocholine esterase n=1 Tax=Alteripontixanthobacter maritimus TaxID=2161824 RepID=A0A369Q7K5_9SPHN|nr:alpha/beta fold hydrolase [Alteripontixanthobacter maritimus]RDC60861.1 hypothetical protein HME9302_02077 [Alteripontixanthobacter maritimus]